MKRFVQLITELDQTTRTSEKVAALESYFSDAPPLDAAWALHFLLGRRGRRPVKTLHMRNWVAEATGFPEWLVEECYDIAGDLDETLSLLMNTWAGARDREPTQPLSLAELITTRVMPLTDADEGEQRRLFVGTLQSLEATERFIYLKLLTGGFRLGVSRTLVVRALASVAGLSSAVMQHRLMAKWEPTPEDYRRLLVAAPSGRDPAQPYPFYLASPIEQNVEPITDPSDWQAEWKWDGIRAQLIRRAGQTVLWSRGEEVITPGFPEIERDAHALEDGTVLDGEILAWRDEAPLPFNALQNRLGRKTVSKNVQLATPVVFMAYDILEHAGKDCRLEALSQRRARLETVVASADARFPQLDADTGGATESQVEFGFVEREPTPVERLAIRLSPIVRAPSMNELAAFQKRAREVQAEGLMLKRRDSAYGVGRERGAWWKWKVDPYTIDAVMIAAQPGHGKRAGLFTDYTFGIWKGDELLSFAKAYSGLTAEEIQRIDRWIRENITGRHGPVRTVKPELVFELAFEGVQESGRHRAGLALRFPRIARWRKDKPAAEADRIETLKALLGDTNR